MAQLWDGLTFLSAAERRFNPGTRITSRSGESAVRYNTGWTWTSFKHTCQPPNPPCLPSIPSSSRLLQEWTDHWRYLNTTANTLYLLLFVWGAHCESLSVCFLFSFIFSCSCLSISNSEQSKQEHTTTSKRWRMCVCVCANIIPSSFVTPFFRYLVSSLILCLSCLSSTHEDTPHHHNKTSTFPSLPHHHNRTSTFPSVPRHHNRTSTFPSNLLFKEEMNFSCSSWSTSLASTLYLALSSLQCNHMIRLSMTTWTRIRCRF